MAPTLLDSHKALSSSDPGAALLLSQQAPSFLSRSASRPGFPSLLSSAHENADQWAAYEQLLFACLRTGDDKSAYLCLDRLTERFGPSNERVMGLRGMYQEAIAGDTAALENVLHEYEKILSENPVNVVRVARSEWQESMLIISMVAHSQTPRCYFKVNVQECRGYICLGRIS